MRTLYVAAGGGGDAVGALLARRALGDTDERPPLVTTCAWERLRIDPVPGPRARTDFTGLGLVGGEPCEVLPMSDTIPSGRSVLPRLAETSGARIFLHDFNGGAVDLVGQFQQLSESLDVDHLVVLDVGGDVLARGSEPALKSPLADSLTLAAALGSHLPTTLVVLGPGSDAELPEAEVLSLLGRTRAEVVGRVSPGDVRNLEPVLSWHPTEATALVAAAAQGTRGRVAMRRGQTPVPITKHTPGVWKMEFPTFESFPLAGLLLDTTSLSTAEDIMRWAAVDEIDFERRVADDKTAQRGLKDFSGVISDIKAMGATHITSRRLAEALSRTGQKAVESAAGRPSVAVWSVEDLVRFSPLADE